MNFVSVLLQVFVAGINTWNQLLQLQGVGQRKFPIILANITLAMFRVSEFGVYLGVFPTDLAVDIVWTVMK